MTTPKKHTGRWGWFGRIPPKGPTTTLHLVTLTLLQGGLSTQKKKTTTPPQSSSRASADLPSCA